MPGDDTYLADTSVGELTVQYGWNNWISVQGRGSKAHTAVVTNRRALERLLAERGVPDSEARPLAAKLWKARPKRALRSGEAEAWATPWEQHPRATLSLALLLLVAMAVVGVALKTGIVFL